MLSDQININSKSLKIERMRDKICLEKIQCASNMNNSNFHL